jgi:hypothetical protein
MSSSNVHKEPIVADLESKDRHVGTMGMRR